VRMRGSTGASAWGGAGRLHAGRLRGARCRRVQLFWCREVLALAQRCGTCGKREWQGRTAYLYFTRYGRNTAPVTRGSVMDSTEVRVRSKGQYLTEGVGSGMGGNGLPCQRPAHERNPVQPPKKKNSLLHGAREIIFSRYATPHKCRNLSRILPALAHSVVRTPTLPLAHCRGVARPVEEVEGRVVGT